MRKAQRATQSPRPADVATAADASEAAELPRFDEGQLDYSRVAQRAYERWEARGRDEGRDMEDWLEAERELRQSPSQGNTGRAAAGSTVRANE